MDGNQPKLLTRRQFLGTTAVSAAALAWGCGGTSSLIPLNGDFDAIVVGAGIGGMGAAQALRAAGKTVLVLEAQGHVGGRVRTNNTLARPFDYGAQFFDMVVPKKVGPGTENPLYDLAVARGLRIVPEAGTDSFLMLNGVPASEEDTLTVVGNLIAMDAAMKEVGEAAADGGPDMSGADACAPLQGNPLIKLATSILVNQRDFMDKTSCLDYYNQNILLEAPIGVPSNDTFFIPDGYGNFIETFADGLNIMLNTPVTAIDTRDTRIKVETPLGTVTAKYVIVAVPQSVLVGNKIKFTPAIPAITMGHLLNLPMYTVDKIGIEFGADVFAGLRDNTFIGKFVDSEESPSFITKFMGGNMASMLIGGNTVLDLEAGGMSAIEAFARQAVRDTFGTDVAAAIDKIVCHPWGTDPWAGGAWTMAKVGGAASREALLDPFNDRVYLAGEPYARQVYGTTQAAYISGQSAAAKIVARL